MTADVLYISGPMTGQPEHGYPSFHQAAGYYRDRGYEVINPAELDEADGPMDWVSCMRRDLVALSQATTIVALPGWQKSKGARLEVHIAMQLGFGFIPYFPKEEL